MKKILHSYTSSPFFTSGYVFSQTEAQHQKEAERAKLVNTRVDNNGYWRKMAALGTGQTQSCHPGKTGSICWQ